MMEAVVELKRNPIVVGNLTFHPCAEHGGYWFGPGEMEMMIDRRIVIDPAYYSPSPAGLGEHSQVPTLCPECQANVRLFPMRCYCTPEVSMLACSVCHGRWIDGQNLFRLQEYIRYMGLMGVMKKIWKRFAGEAAM